MITPHKVTPIHEWHTQHGGQMSVATGWVRATAYGKPDEEVRNVITAVGIFDDTPLAKIDVRGKKSEEFLGQACRISMPKIGGCITAVTEDNIPAYVARLTAEKFMVLSAPQRRNALHRRLSETAALRGC